jgi:hypothetical protein
MAFATAGSCVVALCRLGVAVVFSALYHQKAGKLSHSRRSIAGRLPQSRESAGGAAAALLSKQPLQQQHSQQQLAAGSVRGVYSSRVSSHAGAVPTVGIGNQNHAVHGSSGSSGHSQQAQHHVRQLKAESQGGAAIRGISSSGHVLQPLAVGPEAAVVTGGVLQQQGGTPRMHSRGGAAAAAAAAANAGTRLCNALSGQQQAMPCA